MPTVGTGSPAIPHPTNRLSDASIVPVARLRTRDPLLSGPVCAYMVLFSRVIWLPMFVLTGAMLRARGFRKPSLWNAHTPVQTVNAPSLPDIVLSTMVMFSLAERDMMLTAASGDGTAVPFRHGIPPFANSVRSLPVGGSPLWYTRKPRYAYLPVSSKFANL